MRTIKQRLLCKILLGAIIVFILDLAIGSGLRWLYFHRAFGNRKNLIYVIEKMNDPIVIMGSSRARHHYVPSLFQSAFNKSCFNAGQDGAFIEYHEALLEAILSRYVPEIVILDISLIDFEESPTRLQVVSSLFPFYAEHPELRSLLYSCGPFERIKMISKIYPFNSKIYPLMVAQFIGPGRIPDYPDGYIPLLGRGSFPMTATEELDQSILDKGAKKAFKTFVSRVKENNVTLYVIVSPSFKKNPATKSMDYAQMLCRGDGIPFWDLSRIETILQHPEYFRDRSHLNDQGARVFSQIVIDRIKGFESSSKGKTTQE